MRLAVVYHNGGKAKIQRISVREFSGGDRNRTTQESDQIVAILQGYFDDSSDERRERFSAVGGLIGSVDQWDLFEPRWCIATQKLTEPFRSAECETQHGQFVDWDKADCDELMKTLVALIFNWGLHGFGSIVPIREYRSVFPNSDEFDPYMLALRHTIINMAHLGAIRREVWLQPCGIKIWHDLSLFLRQTVKTQLSLNGELSHGIVT